MGFLDLTGWARVVSESPLVLLTGEGARRAPGPRKGAAVSRLNGRAAGRGIRELFVADLPIGVRALALRADVSPGSVSKLFTTLAAEGVVDRDERGAVTRVRRGALINRWTRDYSFTASNPAVGHYLAPRGMQRVLDRLPHVELPVAMTGSAAARRMLPDGTTPVVPLQLLSVYTSDPMELARELSLIETEPRTANVVVAVPQDETVLAVAEGDVQLAPTALVLADLLTLPNRSDAEAAQLLEALTNDGQTERSAT